MCKHLKIWNLQTLSFALLSPTWNINDQTTLPPSLPIRKNQPSRINYNMCLAKGIIIYEVLHKLQIIKVHFYD